MISTTTNKTGISRRAAEHLSRVRRLLTLEYEFEREEARRISEETGIRSKVLRGTCWHPVRTGRSFYNSMNTLSVEIFRTADTEIEHSFEYGRQIVFFSEDPSGNIRLSKFSATVSYVDGDRLVATLPSLNALSEIESMGSPGILLSFDETSYRAMFEALDKTINAAGTRLAELRELLIGPQHPSFRQLPRMSLPWLNKSQEEAVIRVLSCRDVAIVHGPPGTGKTTTLVEAINETLRRETQVMVCAQSNTAVDWICEKLVDRGIAVLRIGNPTRVNDKMLSFTYERQFEAHPSYPELWSIRKTIRELSSTMKNRNRDAIHNRLRHLRKRATELEVTIDMELFDNARVVASTLVGSGHRLLQCRRFATLFVDEAGQAPEAACWIALRKADRVVLAGDHCQLPPTVKSIDALRGGLGKTLMEYVAEEKPETVSLLTVQYRMNRQIMQFSSDWFYEGKLTAAPEVSHRGILDFDTPMEWIDTSGMDFPETFISAGNGRLNPKEGDFFISKVEEYAERIGRERILDERIDFALISPYKAQVQYLRRRLRKSAILRPLRGLITVDTIDGFQGRERDVVFISLVRSNDNGQIGFLNDLRRMNVAITRARMKVVIVGAATTLSTHPFYDRLYNYILESGS